MKEYTSTSENPEVSPRASHKTALNTERDQAVLMVLTDLLREQKRRRITDTLFRTFYFLIFASIVLIIMAIGSFSADHSRKNVVDSDSDRHTAVVELTGAIIPSLEENFNILDSLKQAFQNELSAGVILKINSPGGSPVVADELFTNIKSLRKKYPNKPFHVVTGDVCASGGYYVAMAADNIYVNPSSIVGSIGVIHMGFGIQQLMDTVGIVPRIITSGRRKALLNPFEPMTTEDQEHMKKLMNNVHQRFIAVVKEGRKGRLKSDDVFNGLFWAGEEAVQLGLADGIGSVQSVAKDVIGEENIVKYESSNFTLSNFAKITLQEIRSIVQQNISGSTVQGFSLTAP